MWRLISTWDRTDDSVSRMYVWSDRARPPRRTLRPTRRTRTRPATGSDLGALVANALGPVVASHGIDVAPQPSGNSVVWCSQVRTVGQDADPDDPGWCTDLWVHIDEQARTIAVALEGHGLAEHVTGRTHWDGPIDVELDDDLDTSLGLIAGHLDRLCGDTIVAVAE